MSDTQQHSQRTAGRKPEKKNTVGSLDCGREKKNKKKTNTLSSLLLEVLKQWKSATGGVNLWQFLHGDSVKFPSPQSRRKNSLWQSAETWLPYLSPAENSATLVSPSPKSWGIISASAAHIRLTCWGSAASAPSLAALCPSIFPVPFPPSCCASSLDRSLLRPPVLSFLLFLSASPHTLASHPSRRPCSLKAFFFSLPPPSFPSSARSYYFAFIRPLPPSLPLSGSLYPAPALLFFLITDSLFLSIPLPDLPPPNPSYPIPSLS